MPFNGTGSNVTSLNANNISSGTLPVARGGTGTASPSLVAGSGIAITGTWPNQTVATSGGGGVTSLNGQTGAITNTNIDAIGSYVAAVVANNAPGPSGYTEFIGQNGTIAGSSLRWGYSISGSVSGMLGGLAESSTHGAVSYISGGSSLSGTWRCVGRSAGVKSSSAPYGNSYNWIPGIFVRIS